jgi:ankyrin repeat protein
MRKIFCFWNGCFILAAICFCGCSNSPRNLYIKISRGDEDALDKYIQKGFDVNTRVFGESLLSKVVVTGKYDMVEILLNHGANPNTIEWHSSTPLLKAVLFAKPLIVQSLIEHGADVKRRDSFGNNAVWYSVGGNPENTYLLVLAGGNVNNVNIFGETPLVRAVDYQENTKRGYMMITTLLSLGANVNCTNSQGLTPLSIAEKSDDINVVTLLLKYQKKR